MKRRIFCGRKKKKKRKIIYRLSVFRSAREGEERERKQDCVRVRSRVWCVCVWGREWEREWCKSRLKTGLRFEETESRRAHKTWMEKRVKIKKANLPLLQTRNIVCYACVQVRMRERERERERERACMRVCVCKIYSPRSRQRRKEREQGEKARVREKEALQIFLHA